MVEWHYVHWMGPVIICDGIECVLSRGDSVRNTSTSECHEAEILVFSAVKSDETPLTKTTNTSMHIMLLSILVLCIASIVSASGSYPPAVHFSVASSVSAGALYTPETDSE